MALPIGLLQGGKCVATTQQAARPLADNAYWYTLGKFSSSHHCVHRHFTRPAAPMYLPAASVANTCPLRSCVRPPSAPLACIRSASSLHCTSTWLHIMTSGYACRSVPSPQTLISGDRALTLLHHQRSYVALHTPLAYSSQRYTALRILHTAPQSCTPTTGNVAHRSDTLREVTKHSAQLCFPSLPHLLSGLLFARLHDLYHDMQYRHPKEARNAAG